MRSAVRPAKRPAASPTPSPSPSRRAWGVYTPGYPDDLAAVGRLEDVAGRPTDYVMWYVHWAGPWSAPPVAQMAAVLARGQTPVITWMSDDPADPAAAAYRPRAIAAGSQDAYVKAWATAIRRLGGPVLIRLDHEMNGNWMPWSPGVNGNSATDYVDMWRHVHKVFAAARARNVTWVWSPNVAYPGSAPLDGLYPGDSLVDRVGVDGYNWGGVGGNAWVEPAALFTPTIAQIRLLTSRPLMIAEVGCAPTGDKAAWVTAFFAYLEATPDIRSFIWFDADKETDWRFDDSAADSAAFAAGLATLS